MLIILLYFGVMIVKQFAFICLIITVKEWLRDAMGEARSNVIKRK